MDQAIRYSRGPAVAIVALEFLILVAFVGDSCWQWSAVGVASHESEAWQGDHCIPVMPQCFFENDLGIPLFCGPWQANPTFAVQPYTEWSEIEDAWKNRVVHVHVHPESSRRGISA